MGMLELKNPDVASIVIYIYDQGHKCIEFHCIIYKERIIQNSFLNHSPVFDGELDKITFSNKVNVWVAFPI